jgi:hypothetical protein
MSLDFWTRPRIEKTAQQCAALEDDDGMGDGAGALHELVAYLDSYSKGSLHDPDIFRVQNRTSWCVFLRSVTFLHLYDRALPAVQ